MIVLVNQGTIPLTYCKAFFQVFVWLSWIKSYLYHLNV